MMNNIKMRLCLTLSFVLSLLASVEMRMFAAGIGAELNVNSPVFSYIEESGVRTAKVLEISGTLSHGMDERVVGVLEKGDGTIADACEADAVDGRFNLKFVLDDGFVIKNYKLVVNSLNSKKTYEKDIAVRGLGTKAEFISFSVGGNKGTINSGNIVVNADNVYKLKEVVPVFEVTENASVYINNVLQESGISKVDFSDGAVTYKVVSEDLKTIKTYTVTVKGKKESSDFGGSGGSSGSGGGININIPVTGQGQPQYQPSYQSFMDLDAVPWAAEYINKIYRAGVVSGNGNGQFFPTKNVTREEFVKMIVLTLGISRRSGVVFDDVSEDDWFYPYIDIAYSEGIIKGVSETEFGVGQYITREDMAVITYRAMAIAGKSVGKAGGANGFADDNMINDYAVEAVYSLQSQGIISGIGDNMFNPKGYTQRSAAAKVLCLVMER